MRSILQTQTISSIFLSSPWLDKFSFIGPSYVSVEQAVMSCSTTLANESSSFSKSNSPESYAHPDANIRNFAPVARIMKSALPENAKIAKEAKECMQECVSEFISFITSEGMCTIGILLLFAPHALADSSDVAQHPRNANKRKGRRSTARISSLP